MEGVMLILLLCLTTGAMLGVHGEDPYLFFTWNITYGTLSPLGVPQQVILINDQFPGPVINSTSNNNVVINVFNNIDEPFLLTWSGIQQRKNSWQEGVPGTNCPIPPGSNYTYHFQVKDQIGSFIYYPSTALHRASGAFGGLHINSRLLIPVPYPDPEDDYTVVLNDWYTKSHKSLRTFLDSGRSLGRPDGVLINGKNAKGDGKDEPLFTMKPDKTYKYRVCNAGIKTSLNFRIQGHEMKLVEMEGSHVVQNVYESLDVHVGQCLSVLVRANQAPKDYYMVASTRFMKTVQTAKGIIRYTNGKGPASPELPEAPVGWAWSLNQFRSFRWNLTASAARPNPQGSYHYGSINITRTIKLVNSPSRAGGKLRYAINGVSHTDTETPLKLAEYYGIADKVFKYDTIKDDPPPKITEVVTQPNVLNMTFRNFVEIIFENPEKSIQSWHLDGYSFFAVAVEPGTWTPEKRKNYNLLDAVSRTTVQVFPKSWAAIFLTFDNAGMWNIRSEVWERTYLGQQLYASVISPARSLRDEYNIPDNALLCGLVKDLPKPPPYSV
ncbi:multicopper oxidase, putative [Ricinus communis]|uniref:Multicopper oxidase, putative n=1 Tax=Ricinus communis TaxID=3988 RepID=B9SBL2_RICCO|nr:multicopper oxidase, putative [Ricinus communis]|eukprot:XP_002523381.1 L-ascorbate oxidase homolog [Ricinus communis]